MKLIVIIVQDADAPKLRDALVKNKIPVTRLSSTGGFLRRGSTTFISGVQDDQVEFVQRLVDSNSQKRSVPPPGAVDVTMRDEARAKVDVGGATVFVLNVAEFEKV